ncbi:BPSS1780 family membrane protein [Alcaligenes sp. SDU_A2]|uniref:BPSS1780 family membrane protein n=1 Tax=Alcaligenes sp. SDU_A2 TaxID=3136634 RepID=UPI002B783C99|nr:BPSS1780 family membrane protein [Alcaligenes sp.]HRL26020.1 BPSS1780 family membrane protein [Alcaligenes sp.]
MQAAKLPFLYGWYWIQEGIRLFKLQPAALFFWSLATSILINLSMLFPVLGQMLLIVLVPSMTFIVQNACRRIDAAQIMRLGMWLEPVKPAAVRKRLLLLGLIYLLACLAAGFLATAPFVPELSTVMNGDAQSINPEEVMAVLRKPMLAFFVIYIGLSALFWHAPALVGWHAVPIKQALFFSMIACWRNKAAFLLYGLCWAAAFYGIQTLGQLMMGAGLGASVITVVLTPLNLAIAAVLYASFYPAYRSVFGDSAPRSGQGFSGNGTQL